MYLKGMLFNVKHLRFRRGVWSVIQAVVMVLCCSTANAQERISLAGTWERWIGEKFLDNIAVPSSYSPIGTARLIRDVIFPKLTPDQRLLLCFEGVAGNGTLFVNGKKIGTLIPLIRQTFDITGEVKPELNRIEIDDVDWQTPLGLGPAAAWEDYGGISYGVYAEVRPNPYIENARLSYTLSDDLTKADCKLDVFVNGTRARDAILSAQLLDRSNPVSQVKQNVNVGSGITTVTLSWKLGGVRLWSPDDPHLYKLLVKLESPSGHTDFKTETGFRSLVIKGNKFFLNGQPFVFKGIARHGTWGGQGYTLTPAQIEQDFRLIKAMGANAIRLVHYPHAPEELEAAARLGFFVSQEPGFTWIDFNRAPRTTIETGLEVLEGEIQRDWNNPAFFVAYLANESTPTLELMKETRQRVKALDPSLFVSMPGPSAPDHKLASMKKLFDDAGFDFYTTHPYTYDTIDFTKALDVFGTEKPTLFTEWGGPVGKFPRMLSREVKALGALELEGRLSGSFFWEWADMVQYNREDISMDPPVLVEGVTTQDRQIRHEVYSRLEELYHYDIVQNIANPRTPTLLSAEHVDANVNSNYTTVPLQSVVSAQEGDWAGLQSACQTYWKENRGINKGSDEAFWTWDTKSPRIGPVPFKTAQLEKHTRPLVILTGHTAEIPVRITADRLHFLGNVTAPDGYPTRGKVGEEVGDYVIVYRDGEKQSIPLRWGYEVTRGNVIVSSTRVNPVALSAIQVLDYVKQISREQYRTFLFTVPVKHKMIDHIIVSMKPLPSERPLISLPNETGSGYAAGETALLLYGVTAEELAASDGNKLHP